MTDRIFSLGLELRGSFFHILFSYVFTHRNKGNLGALGFFLFFFFFGDLFVGRLHFDLERWGMGTGWRKSDTRRFFLSLDFIF